MGTHPNPNPNPNPNVLMDVSKKGATFKAAFCVTGFATMRTVLAGRWVGGWCSFAFVQLLALCAVSPNTAQV